MDLRQKELIAIGAAVTANCVPCLKYHLAQAEKAGATKQEVTEAIEVGRTVRAGAARIWDEEADAIQSQPAQQRDGDDGGTRNCSLTGQKNKTPTRQSKVRDKGGRN